MPSNPASSPSPESLRRHEWLKERRTALLKWLSPRVEGDEDAGRFLGRPTREIAAEFSKRFGIQVSERTALRYMHEALAWARRNAKGNSGAATPPITLPTRGRPKSESPPKPRPPRKKRLLESELPKLLALPRPLKAVASEGQVRVKEKGATAAVETAVLPVRPPPVPAPPRAKPGPKPRFERWGRIWWELQALTGWSARALYQHLSGLPTLKPLLGSRASFVQALADLHAPRPSWNPVAVTQALPQEPQEAYIEDLRACGALHILHLHAVLLSTARGEWAVLLLAFDPQTLFINATLLDFEGPTGTAAAASPRGRPRKQRETDWRVTVEEHDGAAEIQLSAAAYWALIVDTVGKTGIPYSPIWLSASATAGDGLLDALKQLAPDEAFAASPAAHWHRAPLAFHGSIQTLCKTLASEINAHNRAFAQPNLRTVRARIDELLDRGRVQPGTLAKLEDDGLYDTRRDRIIILGLPHPPRPDVRRSALLSAFQAGYPRLSARGHLVAIKPRRIASRFISRSAAENGR